MRIFPSSVLVGLVALLSSSFGVDAQRSPQGFLFLCDTARACPSGQYQDYCPLCYYLSTNALQCYCFDSDKTLQEGSTLTSANKCKNIIASPEGFLSCENASEDHLDGECLNDNEVEESVPPTQYVDFKFNCVDGVCPSGSYQKFCPRCVINTNSTPPNSPEDSITCLCFNYEGQIYPSQTTIWDYESCSTLSTSSSGKLICGKK